VHGELTMRWISINSDVSKADNFSFGIDGPRRDAKLPYGQKTQPSASDSEWTICKWLV